MTKLSVKTASKPLAHCGRWTLEAAVHSLQVGAQGLQRHDHGWGLKPSALRLRRQQLRFW